MNPNALYNYTSKTPYCCRNCRKAVGEGDRQIWCKVRDRQSAHWGYCDGFERRDVPTDSPDVPALLAEVERLRERNEKLERVKEAARLLCDDAGDAMVVGACVCGTEEVENLRNALPVLDGQEVSDEEN